MSPTLRRPLSFSTDLWLLSLSEAFLAALSDVTFLQACGLRRARSDGFVVRPVPGAAPAAATCLAAPGGPTEPCPGSAPHSSPPPPEARVCCPQMRIKPSTLGGAPGSTGSVRREHRSARERPSTQPVWELLVFPSGVCKEPKSREVEKRREREETGRSFMNYTEPPKMLSFGVGACS